MEAGIGVEGEGVVAGGLIRKMAILLLCPDSFLLCRLLLPMLIVCRWVGTVRIVMLAEGMRTLTAMLVRADLGVGVGGRFGSSIEVSDGVG